MYYIYTGITHPRLCEKIELDSKFAYVGNEANTDLFINMLNTLSVSKDKFLEDTFFGKTKCKITKEGLDELQKVSE